MSVYTMLRDRIYNNYTFYKAKKHSPNFINAHFISLFSCALSHDLILLLVMFFYAHG